MVRLSLFTFFLTFLMHVSALAAPTSFTYQGQIIKPSGHALEAASVTFTIDVVSPGAESCILYSENHIINMTGSNGIFALEVGAGTQSGADFEDTNTLALALSNATGTVNPTNCAAVFAYTPASSDGRKLRVTFNDGTGPNTLAQDHNVVSVPYATSASSIDGLTPGDLLRINTSGGVVLSQANLENVFGSNANYTELMALIAGTSTQYFSGTPASDVDMNSQKIINVAAPTLGTDATNKNYVDSRIAGVAADTATIGALGVGQSGQVLTWNGTQWTSSAPSSDNTKLSLSGGTMTGALNMGNQDITNSKDVTVNNDLSVGNDLTVTNNVSITGGIGVGTGINSGGTITVDPINVGAGNGGRLSLKELAASGVNTVSLRSPDTLASDIIFTLPATTGTVGQVLRTDGSGNLSFVDDSAPVTSVFTRTGDVVAAASDYDAVQVDNTAAGNIVATNVQAAINELDTEKVAKSGDTMSGDLMIGATNELRLGDADNSNYVGFVSPAAMGINLIWELPMVDGTSGQVLQTDGSGVLSFVSIPSAPVTTVFGRAGVVAAAASDYDAIQVDNTPAGNIAATNVQAAINELDNEKISGVDGQTLTDGNIWVGDVANDAASVTMSGDATMINTGAITIANNAITSAKIANDEIINEDIKSNADIARSKLADGAINRVVINDGSGVMIDAAAITGNRALISDANGIPVHSVVTNTELSYVNGVTGAIQTQIDGKVAKAGDTMTGSLNIDNEQELRLSEADGSGANYVGFKAPSAVTLNFIWELPDGDGTVGQVLETDGAGVLRWKSLSAVGETNTASNQGVGGIGVWDAKSGVDLQFRNINALNNKVSVALDAGNKKIDIGVNEANFNQSAITNTPAGNIAATNIQAAINELDNEKISSVDGQTLTDGNIWVGDVANDAASVAMSGDATMVNTGALTIAANAITSAKIANDEIINEDIKSNADIARSKLADGAINRVVINNGSGVMIDAAAITGNRALISDANGIPTQSAVTNTELSYVNGVTGAIQTQIDSKVAKAGDTMTGSLNIDNEQELRLSEADGSGANYVGFKSPTTLAANVVWTLPGVDGTVGQVLETNGSGVLQWKSLSAVGESNTASNQGVAGVGVYKQKTGVDIELRNINAASNKVTVALDAPNNEIDINVNEANFDPAIIPNTAAGNIAAANVQAAINELDNEKVAKAGDTMSGDLMIGATNEIRLGDADNSNYVGFVSPAIVGSNLVWELPAVDGTSGQFLQTDGSGQLVFASVPASGETNTASNQGVGGIGVWDAKSGVDLQFRNINALNNKVSVALDAGNKKIDIGVNEANFDPAVIPNTVAGNIAATNIQAAINELDGDKVAKAGDIMSGNLTIATTNELRLGDADNDRYVGFVAPAVITAGSSFVWELPPADGTSGQVLQTNGSGALSWTTPTTTPAADSLDFTHFSDAMTLDTSTDIAVTGTDVLSITNTGTGSSFRVNDSAADTTPFIIDDSGNVGIGTNAPISALHINKGLGSLSSGIAFGDGDTGIYENTDDNLRFHILGVDRWFMNSSSFYSTSGAGPQLWAGTGETSVRPRYNENSGLGWISAGKISLSTTSEAHLLTLDLINVGIGTTTPSEKLDVEGTILSGPKGVAAGNGGAIKFEELAANAAVAGVPEYVGFRAPDSIVTNVVWQLPAADGTSGQVLQTSGSGILTWAAQTAADNLGNHTATTNLDMNSNGILGVSNLNVTNGSESINLSGNGYINSIGLSGATRIGLNLKNTSTANNSGSAINFESGSVDRARISGNYRPTAGGNNGDLRFFTLQGGSLTESMRLDENGNVGIGTVTPSKDLHIHEASTGGTADASLLLTTNATGVTSSDGIKIGYYAPGGDDYGYITVGEAEELRIGTSGVEQMRIDASGNVGIGTTTPGEKLDVEGSILSGPKGTGAGQGGAIKFEELAANGVNTVGFRAPDSIAANILWELPAADGTSGQVLQTNGSGVLNWVSPTPSLPTQTGNSGKFLTTNGTAANWSGVSELADGDNNTKIYVDKDGLNDNTIRAEMKGSFEVWTIAGSGGASGTNSVTMSIKNASSGNSSNLRFGHQSGGIYGYVGFEGNRMTLRSESSLMFETNGANERARIDTSGNFGIGSTSPRAKLDVNGSIASAPAVVDVAGTINFANSNFAYTASNCGAFVLENMKDGATYTLAVQGTTSTTCSFTAYPGLTAGGSPHTVKLPPSHAATTATKETLYSFVVIGTKVYVAWVPGY